MKKRVILLALLILGIITVPSTFALDVDIGDSIGVVGEFLASILNNQWAVFGVTWILLVMLVYSLLGAGLARVPAFEGSGGTGVNQLGKIIAVSGSILINMSIVYFTRGNVNGFIDKILGPAGLYAAIILAIIIFIYLRKALGDHQRFALALTGLACFALAGIARTPIMNVVGIIVILAAVIMMFRGDHVAPAAREREVGRTAERAREYGQRMKHWGRRAVTQEGRAALAARELAQIDQREQEVETKFMEWQNFIDQLIQRIIEEQAEREHGAT